MAIPGLGVGDEPENLVASVYSKMKNGILEISQMITDDLYLEMMLKEYAVNLRRRGLNSQPGNEA